ncbi:MAG TPA: PTS sugar transporter subunit IIA [Elusimicrobiota bacterium]|nr:PTS sugar transporter subunit IIA [Elusimicrobiota bacterium]
MSWFQKKAAPGTVNTPQSTPAPRAVKGLKIAPLLSEDVILFPVPAQDKSAILESLTAAVCRKAGLADPARFLAKVEEREQGISTTLDTGLSLPHARMDGIDGILAGMAVLKTPIPDPQQAELPIRVVFLFFSPNKQEAFPVHLQLLRGVSSLFQPALIDQLTAAAGPADALALVRKLEG